MSLSFFVRSSGDRDHSRCVNHSSLAGLESERLSLLITKLIYNSNGIHYLVSVSNFRDTFVTLRPTNVSIRDQNVRKGASSIGRDEAVAMNRTIHYTN